MDNYNSFSGLSISEVFNGTIIQEIQKIEYKVKRVKSFTYCMTCGKSVVDRLAKCEHIRCCICGYDICWHKFTQEDLMKLKERDRRPKYQFEPGDLVEFHGSVRESQGGRGLVLETSPHSKGDGFQTCIVAFGGREEDLFRHARRYISHIQAQAAISFGAEVINTKLIYKGKAPRAWLTSISAKEVRSIRFMKILDEEDY